jgi:DNA-binding response OmpR family regulator
MPRILAIEDDPIMRELLRMHLSKCGMTVDLAEDAAVGIRALLLSPPDLIILDPGLPFLGGLEVLKALKGEPATRSIPVLILTSRTDEDCYREATRLGADLFLTKPVKRDQLVDSVMSLLEKKAAQAPGSA